MLVSITSNGKEIAKISTEQFQAFCGVKNAFLPELIIRFNAEKERLGEPERVQITLKR